MDVDGDIARLQRQIEEVENDIRKAENTIQGGDLTPEKERYWQEKERALRQEKQTLREEKRALWEKERALLEQQNKLLDLKLKNEDDRKVKRQKSDVDQSEDMAASVLNVDKSEDWAKSVLTPFVHKNIAEAEDLKNALVEPLPVKIPIVTKAYKTLDPQIAEHFVPSDVYRADFISAHINIFMKQNLQGGSESMQQSLWDIIFATFWESLLSLTETEMIKFDRNVTDFSGASSARVRPDLLLWSMNRLVAKFEEKKASLQDAYKDLLAKLSVLPRQFFGPVDWIIGVGLASGEMCVWALKQGREGVCL